MPHCLSQRLDSWLKASDKEPEIAVRKPGPTAQLTPQNDQLPSECRVLCFKPAVRLEWRGQDARRKRSSANIMH